MGHYLRLRVSNWLNCSLQGFSEGSSDLDLVRKVREHLNSGLVLVE